MLRLMAFGLLFFGTVVLAEDPKAVKLTAPEGWTGETIELPPSFAPDMKLKGSEHIRFAPGMMNPASDSFFSYAFAFELQSEPALTQPILKDELLKYYRGLCKTVLNGKLPDVDPSKFTLTLDQEKNDKNAESPDKESITPTRYTGVLDWVEPFATKKSQKLNLEVQTWAVNKRNMIFVCVSPQPRDNSIWKPLHTIRDDYLKSNPPRGEK